MKYLGYIYLAAYVFLQGFIGVFTQNIQGMDVQTIVFARAILAVLFILGVIVLQGEWQVFKLVNIGSTFLVSVSLAVMMMLFTGALMYTSVANTILFFYAATCCSLLFARLYQNEDLPAATRGNLVFCLVGLLMVAEPSQLSLDSTEMWGNLMALGSGLSYAGLLVWAKPLAGKVPSAYIPFWQHLFIALALLPLMDFSIEGTVLVDNSLPLLGLGFLSTGLACLMLAQGIRRVPMQHTLVMTVLEPVVAIVLAALLLGEPITLWTSVGAAFIVVGVYRTTAATVEEPQPVPAVGTLSALSVFPLPKRLGS